MTRRPKEAAIRSAERRVITAAKRWLREYVTYNWPREWGNRPAADALERALLNLAKRTKEQSNG